MTARYPVVLGIDPSSGPLGMGRLDTLTMTATLSVVLPLSDYGRTWRERLRPELDLMAPGTTHVAIEELPPTTKDPNRRGSQGVIGYAVGRVTGRIEGWADAESFPTTMVPVREWRVTRDAELTRLRVAVPQVARGDEGAAPDCRLAKAQEPMGKGVYKRTWRCGATRLTKKPLEPTTCPACSRGHKPFDREAYATEVHKARSWALASHLWPAEVARLEQAARGRAKDKTQPAWQLSGVSDACEGVLVALHHARRIKAG